MTFGSSPIRNRAGDLLGDQLDMTLADGEVAAPSKRPRYVPPPRCRTRVYEGHCSGELIAKPGGEWLCTLCGARGPAYKVAR